MQFPKEYINELKQVAAQNPGFIAYPITSPSDLEQRVKRSVEA